MGGTQPTHLRLRRYWNLGLKGEGSRHGPAMLYLKLKREFVKMSVYVHHLPMNKRNLYPQEAHGPLG